MSTSRGSDSEKRVMLVFNSAYTFEHLKKYGLGIFIQSRDSMHFFNSVLHVNPVASLQYESENQDNYKKPCVLQFDTHNFVLEGRVSQFKFLNKFKFINFIFSQISLIRQVINYEGFDKIAVVRAEDPRLNGIYGYVFSRILRKPLVTGLWGNPERIRQLSGFPLQPRLFRTSQIERTVEKFVLRKSTLILSQNNENLSYALKLGIDKQKTRIMELAIGIHQSHFLQNSKRKNLNDYLSEFNLRDQFILVCISRLEYIKNVDHAIRACKIIKSNDIKFKLFVIGDGRERDNLQRLVSELDLQDNVIFTGNREQDWIASFLVNVDLNLAPLCGRALLEASLSGVPCVAYNVDWHPELVISGVTGELVSNLNYIELGRAATLLLKNKFLLDKMRSNMLQVSHYVADPTKVAKHQYEIYSQLIGSR
jgi:glycosyltransferase involved in cell wall biosynthesis